jgi:integrase
MASVWIKRRKTRDGSTRYRVEYRAAGREAPIRYAGTFGTRREADVRKLWVGGELAALRMPDLTFVTGEQEPPVTVSVAADRWLVTRIDVAESTKTRHGVELKRIKGVLGSRPTSDLTAAEVAEFVAGLAVKGYSRGTIRKTLQTVAMILDHAGVDPNPARDRSVRLPREDAEELNPPSGEHVETVFRLLPSKHRLALLWLEWSGARVGTIDKTLVGDYDEPRRRVRLRAQTTKTRKALWVELPPVLAEAIEATLPPREDRDSDARLFADSGADALRTAIGKACKAAAIPLWSPHDLRHRRISLLHLRGVPWARIGEFVGQRSLAVTADTYTHVLTDEAEVDYAALLAVK